MKKTTRFSAHMHQTFRKKSKTTGSPYCT